MLKTAGAVMLEFLYGGPSWPTVDEGPTWYPGGDNEPSFTSTSAAAQIIHDVYKYNNESSGSSSSASAKNAKKTGGDAKKPSAPAGGGGGGGGAGGAPPAAAANTPGPRAGDAAKDKQMVFRVPMCCGECADTIISMLTQINGVKAVDCDVPQEKVTVKASASVVPEEVLRTCRKLFKKSANW